MAKHSIARVSATIVAGALVPVLFGLYAVGAGPFADAASAPASDTTNLPPEEQEAKDAAVRAGVPVDPILNADPGYGDVDQVDGDRGDPAAIEAATASATQLLVDECLLSRTADASGEEIERAIAALPTAVPLVYAEARVDEIIRLATNLLEMERTDPNVPVTRDCRYELDRRLGAVVDGDHATISIQGSLTVPVRTTPMVTPGVTTADGWEVGGHEISNIEMVHQDEGWRILNLTTTQADGSSING